ncbi:ATP-binding cassette domain-containing protein [Ornithinimicrobium cavernae]|uniref:ATP-binding cassette domain-containing protein n=1 Tax=Ornithinimicrobium cavernae TaxID=2666047 RepID=UPI00192A5040|nr:ATP-binding cassette domain-containing protein [Ornithinimicrobium cavernae]
MTTTQNATRTAPRSAAARDHGGPDILCEDLVRIYSTEGVEIQALQGLNLRVEPGDVVALVGASGSGKSTLLNILSGLDRPTGGRATVAGVNLGSMSRAQRVHYQRHTVGFVWQQTSRNLMPFLTAAENVALPLLISNAREKRERVGELLELLGVSDVSGRRPAEMSGGQQQRVAIATAVANNPAVLLADEPTGELDDAMSAVVLDAMREASEQLGVTVLIVTHDPTIADHVRRTVQIRDGRTSTEVLRHTEVDEHGVEHLVAQEYTVIDRAGRMQLPSGYVTELGLRDRVRLELEPDHVGVWPDAERNRPVEPEPHHQDAQSDPTPPGEPSANPAPTDRVEEKPAPRHTGSGGATAMGHRPPAEDDPDAAFRRPEVDR